MNSSSVSHQVSATFQIVKTPDPHISRRRAIYSQHPDVRALFGPNPYSMLLIGALVVAQLAVASLVGKFAWWWLPLASFGFGAFLTACLYALIHDAAHNLIFSRTPYNRIAAIIANIPIGVVSAETFRRYHGLHHARMGDYSLDVGIPTLWEARWVGNSKLRKTIWLAFFVVFQMGRTQKCMMNTRFFHSWMILNFAVVLLADLLILQFFGIRSLCYLLLCFFFSFGLHPLGARVIQEHFVLDPGQETNNYSGTANVFECNFGCHNEHHDFPAIPWNRLPAVSRIAPEFYLALKNHPSRWALIRTFIFDPHWDLYRHAIRESSLNGQPTANQ